MFVPGKGRYNVDIMFISPAVEESEVAEQQNLSYQSAMKQTPQMLRGPAASIFKEVIRSHNIQLEDIYYTTVCKWLLPRGNRNSPKKDQLNFGKDFLMEEIRRVHPKIIVCMGKPVFDILYPIRFKMSDIQGGWFWSDELQTRLFVMPHITKTLTQPDYVEKFHIDIREVRRMSDQVRGVDVRRIPVNEIVIKDTKQLLRMVGEWRDKQHTLFSVDCEWKGRHHLDGELRSIQLCWSDSDACYIRFMDDKGNYVFDSDYETVGRILSVWLDRPEVKYIGHHFSADAPWMQHVLGLNVYQKCVFDSEFAQQTVDEYEDLSLERLALKYTDLGRYDIELEIWKKRYNAKRCKAHGVLVADAGYAYIPDAVLIPYALRDVVTVFRIRPYILQEMEQQGVRGYYENIVNPFTTDVFTNFVIEGLPIETELMENLRQVYVYVRGRMEELLRQSILEESRRVVFERFLEWDAANAARAYDTYKTLFDESDDEGIRDLFKNFFGVKELGNQLELLDHVCVVKKFNIRSVIHMRRWLFGVKNLVPVKSTNNKDQDMPTMAWSKVLSFPEEVQKKYKPSTDQQTVEILYDETADPMLELLLQLNSVGNIVKAFLKPADKDEDGQIIKENGLAYWVASDNRTHNQYSTTETNRPRAWAPNVLNWPKYVNNKMVDGVRRIVEHDHEAGILPEFCNRYVGMDGREFPSVRSCVSVREMEPLPGSEGWCMVESDLDTAEIVGAAYISGDFKMISAAIDPDPMFGVALVDDKEVSVRLGYGDDCGIDQTHQYKELLKCITKVSEGGTKVGDVEVSLRPIKDSEWVRDHNGDIKHPRHDLHWEIAESVMRLPRELLDKDKHRDGVGKPANFSIAYGATETSLERAVKAATKEDPEEGTGSKMLDAYAERYPRADMFFKNQELLPEDPGYYDSVSGRRRHFKVHKEGGYGISERLRGGKLSSEQRQARNFPLQNNVADTMALASIGLLEEYRQLGLVARPMALLYDALVTLCPLEEREQVAKLHSKWMHEKVSWKTPGGILRYTIDTDYCMRWSTKASEADKKLLGDPPPASNIRHLDPVPPARQEYLDRIYGTSAVTATGT